MNSFIHRCDVIIHRYATLLLALALVLLLRIPNVGEPYWYGDEGIYLTLGNGLKQGERLYADIIDHKTPLIYYLAMVPNQFWFRVLLIGWMLVTTFSFYKVTQRLMVKSKRSVFVSTLLFVLFTSWPGLEGNIPNGELFVMGFVMVGAFLLTRTRAFTYFLHQLQQPLPRHSRKQEKMYLVGAGIFFSLGILTKVPALFDWAGWLSFAWFWITNSITYRNLRGWRRIRKELLLFKDVFMSGLLIVVGVLIPIIISVIYYISRGSGQAYLEYGLLYNFRYAGSFGLPFTSPILLWTFTLMGKAAIAGAVVLLLTIGRRFFSPQFQLAGSWTMLALFAALLSNRPYPHYFLQIVPAAALLIGVWWYDVSMFWYTRKKRSSAVASTALFVLIITLILEAGWLLKLGLYPTISYYQRWFKVVTRQISNEEYRNSFNHLMADNYKAAQVIKEAGDPKLFIWGTNPMLYALSDTAPTGRFTVSFHIKDFKAYDESMASIYEHQPTFIVVMKDERDPLPGLDQYLTEQYMPNSNYEYFTLWKKR